MSIRKNPFEEIEQLLNQISRKFDQAAENWEAGDPVNAWLPGRESMAIDMVDNGDELVATVDLPGYDRDDIQVRIHNRTLRIDAEHEESNEVEDGSYLRQERRKTSLHRSVSLPVEIDPETVRARLNNGVLTITLPKLNLEDSEQIDIE